MLLRLCGITGFCALPKMLEERPGDTFLFASSHFRWKTPIDEESQVESYIPLPFVYLWTSVTPQQMKMRQRVRKAMRPSADTAWRDRTKTGVGWRAGLGGGGEGWNWREPTGREPGQLEHPGGGASGLQPLQRAGAAKGPGAGDIGGPQGPGDRKQRPPPKPRDQKGAQVITHRNEWGRRSGGGAEEGPRGGRGTSPSPSPNP